MYQTQDVDIQMKGVINGKLQIRIGRVPNRASVPLIVDMNLEQFDHFSASVQIQLRVQQYCHEQKLAFGNNFESPNNACIDLLR